MPSSLLSAYLRHLSLQGPLPPTHATLCALQHAQMLAIPFENLDVLLGRPIAVDLESIANKIFVQKRGGYCFELNTLFYAVLVELGFETQMLAGRVQIGLPSGTTPTRTHMCMRVELPEGSFVVDAAGIGPRHPIALQEGIELVLGRERHRLQRDEQVWQLQALVEREWRDVYSFTTERRYAIDVEVHNHYTSTHPNSRFKQNLLVQRATLDGGVSLRNDQLTIRHEGAIERHTLSTREQLYEVLRDKVGIDLPEVRTIVAPAVPAWS